MEERKQSGGQDGGGAKPWTDREGRGQTPDTSREAEPIPGQMRGGTNPLTDREGRGEPPGISGGEGQRLDKLEGAGPKPGQPRLSRRCLVAPVIKSFCIKSR